MPAGLNFTLLNVVDIGSARQCATIIVRLQRCLCPDNLHIDSTHAFEAQHWKWSTTLSVTLRQSSRSKTSIRAMGAMAMVLAPSDAEAETVLADLALSSEHSKGNRNLGAVLLSWGAGPRSSTFDLHVQLFAPVHTAIHITGKGGGVISNTWGWGGDHNLVRRSAT